MRHDAVLAASVVEARSGKELIALGRLDRFDLVICDISLPERSGVAVARTARAAGIATPFLFVSGFDVTEAEISSVGAAAFLPKPFALADLEAAVSQLIANYAPRGSDRFSRPRGALPSGRRFRSMIPRGAWIGIARRADR